MDMKALLNRQAALRGEMETLNSLAADSEFTDEQQEQWEAMKAEKATLEAKVERARELLEFERSMKTVPDAAMEAAVDAGVEIEGMVTGGDAVIVKDPKWGFSGLGEYAGLVFEAKGQVPKDPRFQMLAAASGMNQATGSDGGFTVPPEFSTIIWDGLNEGVDSLMSMTDNYVVTGESLTFNANAETSRATGSRFGGAQAFWLAEAEQITSSKPTFRQMKLEPNEIACLVFLTNKLLRNSNTALEQYVTRVCTEEMNFLIADSWFNGDGVGKPIGIIGHSATVNVAKEAGQATATIVRENVDKMWSRCHARARAGAMWFINQDVEPALEQLAADVGTGGVPVYLPPGGIADTPNARLKGRPVMPVEYAATLGTTGDIILANLGFYAVGTQGTTETAMSMHLRFDFMETALRVNWAVDGQPWLASPLTPFKGTKTLSPMVTLATRS